MSIAVSPKPWPMPSTPQPSEPRLRRGAFAALVVVGIAAGAAILLGSAGSGASAAGGRCGVPEEMISFDRPLPHVAAKIAAGGTLTIVALGSSSTFGTGASGPEHSYPARLGALYADRVPGLKVRVLNLGVGGEEAAAMVQRIDSEVLPAHPDLVIWQVERTACCAASSRSPWAKSYAPGSSASRSPAPT